MSSTLVGQKLSEGKGQEEVHRVLVGNWNYYVFESNPIPMISSYSPPIRTLITNMQCKRLGPPIRFKVLKNAPRKTPLWSVRATAGLEEIVENKVLVAASVASVIGQLSKPVASALMGKGLDWRLVIKPGGMPSSHSASIVATATAIGLERGFSDSLFGLSVVIAGIVMYDAQGVRRAVGKQAEVINMIISDPGSPFSSCSEKNSLVDVEEPVSGLLQGELMSVAALDSAADMPQVAAANAERTKSTTFFSREIQISDLNSSELGISDKDCQFIDGTDISSSFEPAQTSPYVKHDKVNLQHLESSRAWRHIPLKESVGHTKVEVLGGALVGLFVTLMLHWTM